MTATVRTALRAHPLIIVTLSVVYGAVLLAIMAPVLVHPIGADDSYWILASGPAYDGSILQGMLAELSRTGDPSGTQARFAQLSYAMRRGSAIAILELAIRLGVAPWAIWSLARIVLLAISIVVVIWFLRRVRWFDRTGAEQRLSTASVTMIGLSLPLVVALGATTQSVSSINGWLEYPLLTYPAVAIVFGTAALVLVLHEALERTTRPWQWGLLAAALAGLAVALNNSYEIYWVAVPLAALVLVGAAWRRPRSEGSRRALGVTLGGFFGVFAVNFAIYRSLISTWNCDERECYPGSQVELSLSTGFSVVKNVIGALPLVHRPLANEDAAEAGLAAIPWATATSVLLAVIAVAVLAVLVRLTARRAETETAAAPERGVLLLVGLSGLGVALGSALITGINQRAPQLMGETWMPYRTGYVTWFGLSLAIIVLVRLIMIVASPRQSLVVALAALTAVAGVVAVSYPQNESSTRANRLLPANEVVNRVHWEVALGDLSEAGDLRRCVAITDHIEARGDDSYPMRTLIGADRAFRFYHGQPFCTAIGPLEGNATIDWTD